MPTFTPPTRVERLPTAVSPFKFFGVEVASAVVFRNGHFVQARVPSQDETDALVEGVTWFTGGRSYTVSADTAALLTTDGFTVI